MHQRFQRVAAVVLVCALFLPLSTFAENRDSGRTDLEQLAADLERIFGKGSARIERQAPSRPGSAATTRPDPRRHLPNVRIDNAMDDAILEAMNRERASRGLVPLRLNSALSAAAGDRVADMLTKRYFAHVSPDGLEPFTWAAKRGYRYRIIGENLALGFQGTAVVDGWMRSPGHRENILTPGFNEVGIASAPETPQRGYRGPTVVALYGRQ